MTGTDVDTQYVKFCEIYKAGVSKHIPHQREKMRKLNEWFDHHCVKAKEKKETYGTDIEDITVRKHMRDINKQEMNTP